MRLWDGSKILVDRRRTQAHNIIAVNIRIELPYLSLFLTLVLGGSLFLGFGIVCCHLTGLGVSSSSRGFSLQLAPLELAVPNAVARFPAVEALVHLEPVMLFFLGYSLAWVLPWGQRSSVL